MARRRGTEQEWRRRLERWPDFDGTVAAFCEDEGVNTKAFYVWRKRFAGASHASDAVEFVEVGRPPEAAVEIVFARGIVVRMRGAIDKVTLRRVVEVLTEQ